jgi:excisionase family DNA binding protein
MKLSQAAKELNRNPITIIRMIRAGKIEAVKIGKLWDIKDEEVQRIKNGK